MLDLVRTGKRLRRAALACAAGVLVAWPIVGVIGGTGLTLRLLGELAGWGVLAVLVAEILIVAFAAISGMLRAGARGDRLAGGDVGLLPPQLRRRPRPGRDDPAGG